MKVFNSILELVGNTPLLKLNSIIKEENLCADIYAKLEYFNPAGSVKDRVAKFMLDDAIKSGKITVGGTVIEPTSGNTGIGLAFLCACLKFKAIIVMPDSMSIERIKLLKAYGAEVVLTKGELGMKGAIDKAKEIQASTPNSIICGQFENKVNPLAHYKSTAKEIYDDLDGEIDFFVAGIGTGGTISGVGKYLKEKNDKIKVVGVEPDSSPLITHGTFGKHKIQGIGANFIPENLDKSVVDEIVTVTDQDAYLGARLIAKTEGVLVGISSGATLSALIKLAKDPRNKGKKLVGLLADGGDRYLSTDLF